MTTTQLALTVITLVAAVVNGALGYGFSSITVPLALLFLSNRVLNPAMVFAEVILNAYALWVNRRALPLVWRPLLPVVIGLLPGVIVGTLIVARVNPSILRFATFVVLLPLILLQAAGQLRRARWSPAASTGFGGGLGVLYSVTTISGPPLALMLTNQGFAQKEFRAGLGFIRLAESTMTATAYAATGLFTPTSLALVPSILPSVVIGVPIGVWLIRRVPADAFRRLCMSFDAWIVGFGLSTLLRELRWVTGYAAYSVLAIVIVIDVVLLRRFFRDRH